MWVFGLAALLSGTATAQVGGPSCATGALSVCFSSCVAAAWDAAGGSLVRLQVVDPTLGMEFPDDRSPIRTVYLDLHAPGGVYEPVETSAREILGVEGYAGIQDAWGWSSVYQTPFRCLGCVETGDAVSDRSVMDLMDAVVPSLLFIVLLVTQLLRSAFHHRHEDLGVELSADGHGRLHHP